MGMITIIAEYFFEELREEACVHLRFIKSSVHGSCHFCGWNAGVSAGDQGSLAEARVLLDRRSMASCPLTQLPDRCQDRCVEY